MGNAHDAIDALINKNNVKKYDQGGKVKNTKAIKGKEEKTKGGYKYTAVVEKPTPTKDKPGDTRLYSASHTTGEIGKGMNIHMDVAESKARYKSKDAPADSLTRADYAKLTKVEEPPKKKKKKRWRKKKK